MFGDSPRLLAVGDHVASVGFRIQGLAIRVQGPE